MTRKAGNSSGSELWRVFCAIELSTDVRSKIQSHVTLLRDAVPESQASWSRVENIHLTIKFFGNVAQNATDCIAGAAARTATNFMPFDVFIVGAGAFPNARQPRVLWIGVDDRSGKLAELQRRFENECADQGFQKEERPFRPHLTVARLRKPEGARALAQTNQTLGFAPARLAVAELVVFRSELSSDGSRYTELTRHKLSDKL